MEELRAPIKLHPQLTKRFSDNTVDGIGTVLNAMVGRSRGSRLGKQAPSYHQSLSDIKHTRGTASFTVKSIDSIKSNYCMLLFVS